MSNRNTLEQNREIIREAITKSLRPDNVARTQKAHALAQRQLQEWHHEMQKVDRELQMLKVKSQ
jgi:hypothetical protein